MLVRNDDADVHDVSGCWGTIAEQKDEAYYDDRSDADDDMEKGRIKFPNDKLYGREEELGKLSRMYAGLALDCESLGSSGNSASSVSSGDKGSKGKRHESGSRVVFLSGYSGVGKSALVNEFIKRLQTKDLNRRQCPTPFACGKYSEQRTAVAPFSAILDAFEKLALELSKGLDKEQITVKGKKHQTPEAGQDSKENGKECKKLEEQSNGGKKELSVGVKICDKIHASDTVGPDTQGMLVLRSTFPVLAPILDMCEDPTASTSNGQQTECPGKTISFNMNAMQSSTLELLKIICSSLDKPLILFLDDLQWADPASFEMLSYLLSDASLKNIFVICAYRSNEVNPEHPFADLMNKVGEARKTDGAGSKKAVEKLDLYSLSPDNITHFLADSINKETDEVSDLSEVVYQKTMGNIFYVMQSIEELVRKNALYYDMMCFEWRWVVSKVELANYMSDDVVETVKGKIKELPVAIQMMLVVMAYIPNQLDTPILKELMQGEGFQLEEREVASLLKKASKEGMLILSSESNNYTFAHDRIRQASQEFIPKDDRDEVLVRISEVLILQEHTPENEWCIYVAVDLLNSVPPEKTDRVDLADLNLTASKIAKKRGAATKENELLKEGLKCLKDSDVMWKNYDLTYEIYVMLMISEYKVGHFNEAQNAIEEVLRYSKSSQDKFIVYLYQMLTKCERASDYALGVDEGIKVLRRYGYDIPISPTKKDVIMAKLKLKVAVKNRPFSFLTDLDTCEEPVFELFKHLAVYCMFSGREKHLAVVCCKAITLAAKKGIDRNFPTLLVYFGALSARKGSIKFGFELTHVGILLCEKFRFDKSNYAFAMLVAYSTTITRLQSFRTATDPLLDCHQDLKISGKFDPALGCYLNYFYAVFAAGLPLGPILESKLQVAEELAASLGKPSFLATFQMQRQFALNLRKVTDSPTELKGEAFDEEEFLDKAEGNVHKMTLRDASTLRLQLAFIFWDEECMMNMLKILSTYPHDDQAHPRHHNRLCFIGLSAYALGMNKLGEESYNEFKALNKIGSFNARPVYLFLKALKHPSKESFEKTIDCCTETHTIHLEAIANERCGAFLLKQNPDSEDGKRFIASAYWLYFDWGAYGKTVSMKKDYEFLKSVTRDKANSRVSSNLSNSTGNNRTSALINKAYSYSSYSTASSRVTTFEYNTTTGSRKVERRKPSENY